MKEMTAIRDLPSREECEDATSTTSVLVATQAWRGTCPWVLRQIVFGPGEDPYDAEALMIALEQSRRRNGWTLYSVTAALGYDTPWLSPQERWPHGATDGERRAYLDRLTLLGYRMAFDLDPASRDDWPRTRDAALRLHDVWHQATGGARLDAYSSGGSRAGVHLEAPTPLQGRRASVDMRRLCIELSRKAGLALLSERLKDALKVLCVDDTIHGKGACGQPLQAPGPRLGKDEQTRRIVETGTGKAWIPWSVLEHLRDADEYEQWVRQQRSQGDDAIVPPWLRPGARGGEA